MDFYFCDKCGKKFKNSKVLANHVRWNHTYPNKGYSHKGLKTLKKKALKREEKHGKWNNKIVTCNHHTCNNKVIIQYKGSISKNYYCSISCTNSRNWDEKHKEKVSRSVKKALQNDPSYYRKTINNLTKNRRSSSKIERQLANKLKSKEFHRHGKAKIDNRLIDIDIESDDNNIWIESDGPFHFKKVHENHDYEDTKQRDKLQNQEAIKRNNLLLRIKNFKYDLDKQFEFVTYHINNWDNKGKVIKLY